MRQVNCWQVVNKSIRQFPQPLSRTVDNLICDTNWIADKDYCRNLYIWLFVALANRFYMKAVDAA